VANVRYRSKKNFQLKQGEGRIVCHENLKHFITEYYKNLFGAPEPNYFTLIEFQHDDVPQLSEEDNNILIANFTEEEVHEAIMQVEKTKAPGPDGFPVDFFFKHFGMSLGRIL
jgi:hypothetical protein